MSVGLRRQDGFTLPELLIAISMAMIVSLATLSLLEVVMKRTDQTQTAVAAQQRGRMAMDTMTRQLRSQVCLNTNPATPPMSAPAGFPIATDANTAVFYTDRTDGTNPSKTELHVFAYNSGTRQLVESDYTGTAAPSGTAYLYTWQSFATPARRRVLLENVQPVTGTPIFTYYTYNLANPPRPDQVLTPAAGGLSAADTARVARIDVTFRAMPAGKPLPPTVRGSTVFQDEVYVRAANPNDAAPTPTCS